MSDFDFTAKADIERRQIAQNGVAGSLSEAADAILRARVSDTRVAGEICQAIRKLDPNLGGEFWAIYSGYRNWSNVDATRHARLIDAVRAFEPPKPEPVVRLADPPAVAPVEASDAYQRMYQITRDDLPAPTVNRTLDGGGSQSLP